jgi:hypothetical protein
MVLAGLFLVAALAVAGLMFGAQLKTLPFLSGLKPHAGAEAPMGVATASDIQRIHADCEAKPSPGEIFECYTGVFQTYMEANGGRKTLELLQSLNDLGGYAETNCHPLSHKVGNIALHVYGSIPAAAPEYLPTCSSGYYHGLLEEYLANAPSYEQGVKTACGDPETEVFFNWFQCMHGTGHGIMQFRADDVPQSLADCDLIDDVKQAREICYGGVFMENITTDEKTGHKTKYIKADDPLYPCDAPEIADKYRSACYFLASSQILKVNGYNMRDAFVQCAKVEDQYRWLCFQSLGRDVSGTTLRNNDLVIEECQYATDPTDAGNCFYGVVRDYINERGEFDTGIALCAQVPEAYKQNCYNAVFLDMGLYKTGQDFLNLCGSMPEPYATECRSKV